MTERLYSTYQVADLLGATPTAVVEWMQKGWLPFQRLPDGPVRVSERGLVTFLKRQGIDIESVMAKAVVREERYRAGREDVEQRAEPVATGRPLLLGATRESPDGPPKPAAPDAGPIPVERDAAATPSAEPSERDRISEAPPEAASQIAEAILSDAVARRATHVHLERRRDGFSLRVRIDGVLHEKANFAERLPEAAAEKLIDHFESMPDPDAAGGERTFTRTFGDGTVEFALTSLTTAEGEKIVIAVRDRGIVWDLSRLDLSSGESERLDALLRRPCGMIVLAGSPRAGREDVLCAMVGRIDGAGRSVALVAGTPDFRLRDLTRIPVVEDGTSGAAEAIGRLAGADTDVILIDELRDPRAILASLDAARRGHLVVAGITARDVRQALGIIRTAGPASWPLASALSAVVGVRVARRVCGECKRQTAPDDKLLGRAGLTRDDVGASVFEAARCDACGETGYAGITAVLSILEVDENLAGLLRRDAGARTIEDAALEAGMKSLPQAGIEKVKVGATTLEELARILPS